MDVKEIETAIAKLPPAKVAELAEWFEEFHAEIWDRQLEQDLQGGRLDSMLKEAEKDLESGRCGPFETPCVAAILAALPRSSRGCSKACQ